MNSLSVTLDFPKLIVSSNQTDIREDVNNRIASTINNLRTIDFEIDEIFESALDSLINHCRDELDDCEAGLENISQHILDSELKEGSNSSFANVRDELKKAFYKMESVMTVSYTHLTLPTIYSV